MNIVSFLLASVIFVGFAMFVGFSPLFGIAAAALVGIVVGK